MRWSILVCVDSFRWCCIHIANDMYHAISITWIQQQCLNTVILEAAFGFRDTFSSEDNKMASKTNWKNRKLYMLKSVVLVLAVFFFCSEAKIKAWNIAFKFIKPVLLMKSLYLIHLSMCDSFSNAFLTSDMPVMLSRSIFVVLCKAAIFSVFYCVALPCTTASAMCRYACKMLHPISA